MGRARADHGAPLWKKTKSSSSRLSPRRTLTVKAASLRNLRVEKHFVSQHLVLFTTMATEDDWKKIAKAVDVIYQRPDAGKHEKQLARANLHG